MKNVDFLWKAFVDSCIFIARYNTNNDDLYIIKPEFENHIFPDQPVKASYYIRNIMESGSVYREDLYQFENLLDQEMIRNLSRNHQNGSLIVYRTMVKDQLVWCRLNISVPDDYSSENPWIAVFSRNMPSSEAATYEAWGLLGDKIHKVLKVNLSTNEYIILKENSFETFFHERSKIEDFVTEEEFVKNGYVHPDDMAAFISQLDHEYIKKYFMDGNSEYQFYYRRKVRGLFRWVKLTIIQASEYTPDNQVVYYYVRDVHKSMLKIIDIGVATEYAHFYAGNNRFSEGYYDNLLEILSKFTYPYLDYYMLDLEKDVYINYKLSRIQENRGIASVANYTEITEQYLLKHYSGEEKEKLMQYSSSEKLQELLKDKITLDYTFTYPDGRKVTTTCVKIESRHGVPTKVLCSTLPVSEEKKLKICTFGNFEVLHSDGTPIRFGRKQSKHLLAYLVDRQGYPVSSKDIVMDILEKEPSDVKAVKYVSTLVRRAMKDLEEAGYPNVIIKESKSVRINTEAVDCDYYHFLNGDITYWKLYHNEYMKEYSWAEETNAELLHFVNI